MVFKDTQTLSGLYEGITKKVEPSKDQLVEQAPILSNTALSKDQDMLAEAYNTIVVEAKKEKPDYMDADKDGDKKESMKKALADKAEKGSDEEEPEKEKKKPAFLKKEGLTFKDLFNRVISEKKKEYDMKGAFHDESESNPQLKKDRERLEKMRKEKEDTKKKKAKK